MKTYKQKQRNKLLWKYSNKYQKKKEHRKTETQNHNRLRHICRSNKLYKDIVKQKQTWLNRNK